MSKKTYIRETFKNKATRLKNIKLLLMNDDITKGVHKGEPELYRKRMEDVEPEYIEGSPLDYEHDVDHIIGSVNKVTKEGNIVYVTDATLFNIEDLPEGEYGLSALFVDCEHKEGDVVDVVDGTIASIALTKCPKNGETGLILESFSKNGYLQIKEGGIVDYKSGKITGEILMGKIANIFEAAQAKFKRMYEEAQDESDKKESDDEEESDKSKKEKMKKENASKEKKSKESEDDKDDEDESKKEKMKKEKKSKESEDDKDDEDESKKEKMKIESTKESMFGGLYNELDIETGKGQSKFIDPNSIVFTQEQGKMILNRLNVLEDLQDKVEKQTWWYNNKDRERVNKDSKDTLDYNNEKVRELIGESLKESIEQYNAFAVEYGVISEDQAESLQKLYNTPPNLLKEGLKESIQTKQSNSVKESSYNKKMIKNIGV